MPKPLSDADRQQISAALAAGESQSAIAKRLGFSKSTVNGIAATFERSEPKKQPRSQTARATAANVEYSRERQRALVGKLLDLVEWAADNVATTPISPRSLQFLMTTVGIGIDKLALLDESSKAAGGEILDLMEAMRRDVRETDRQAGALDPGE